MSKRAEYIGDYVASEHFLFVDPLLKEHAEAILHAWCAKAADTAGVESAQQALAYLARFDIPLSVRRRIPELLTGFERYLVSSGRDPAAGEWVDAIAAVGGEYAAGFRDDGTVRGQTFRKRYADVGRNDPCPCGSGRKFKKCCMKLIE